MGMGEMPDSAAVATGNLQVSRSRLQSRRSRLVLVTLLLIVAGLLLLYFGGDWLVRGASELARRVGVTPLAIGATVVAFGTSSPEFAVDTLAAAQGRPEVSVGDVLGSNIFNIGVVLGVAVLLRPLRIQVPLVRREGVVLILVAGLLGLLVVDGGLSAIDGVVLLAVLVLVVVRTYRAGRREAREHPVEEAEFTEFLRVRRLPSPILAVIGGLACLVGGAQALITGAIDLAELLGVSRRVISLSMVAVGTSLPELATAVVATYRGEHDIAVGNVTGSNIFNIVGVLGAAALLAPLSFSSMFLGAFAIMVGFTLVFVLFTRTGSVLLRWEGLALLAAYGGYLAWVLS